MQPNPIPVLDPNPLPGPFWLFKALLLVTFFLHLVVMNTMLGSAVLALVARGQASREKYAARLAGDIARALPALLAATITLGVAPLLFVQVLYGQFFYTSSILMAWPWFLLLAGLLLAYYGFYYAAAPGRAAGVWGGRVLGGSAGLIAAIAFLQCTNATLSQTPAEWARKYFASPGGWSLNLSEPSLAPRLLHFLAAAVAVAGIAVAVMALRKWNTEPGYARYAFRIGGKALLYATVAQFALGMWFLAALPQREAMIFMGGSVVATASLAIGFLAGLGVIAAIWHALHSENPRTAVASAAGGTGVAVLLMVVMRDSLRDARLEPYLRAGQFTEQTQWSTLPLFLALFAGGVVLWLVMLKRFGLFGGAGRVE